MKFFFKKNLEKLKANYQTLRMKKSNKHNFSQISKFTLLKNHNLNQKKLVRIINQ